MSTVLALSLAGCAADSNKEPAASNSKPADAKGDNGAASGGKTKNHLLDTRPSRCRFHEIQD
ncbi:hypothetical protein ACFTAO_35435 [Paenibacillus rhizoplanae]